MLSFDPEQGLSSTLSLVRGGGGVRVESADHLIFVRGLLLFIAAPLPVDVFVPLFGFFHRQVGVIRDTIVSSWSRIIAAFLQDLLEFVLAGRLLWAVGTFGTVSFCVSKLSRPVRDFL